jgi:hypothetical protein
MAVRAALTITMDSDMLCTPLQLTFT